MNSKMPTDRGHVHTEHHHPDSLALDACTPAQLIKQLARDHESVPKIIAAAADELGAFVQRLVPQNAPGRKAYLYWCWNERSFGGARCQ